MFIDVKSMGSDSPELSIYASMNEVQLKRINEPRPGIFIVETANVIVRALEKGYEPVSLLLDERYLKSPKELGSGVSETVWETVGQIIKLVGDAPVYTGTMDSISRICGFKQSRGIVCAMKRRELPSIEEVIRGANRVAVLEDVENPTNVGAIFRSAVGLGIDAIILTYGSSDPLYRRASRVSMGGVFKIPWTFAGNKYGGWPDPGMQVLKEAGFVTAGMALSDRDITLDDPVLSGIDKMAILFGNEDAGLKAETMDMCDHIVKIPMMHGMDSLNVAAASAVAFWELRKR